MKLRAIFKWHDPIIKSPFAKDAANQNQSSGIKAGHLVLNGLARDWGLDQVHCNI